MVATFESVLEKVKEGPFQYLLFLCCSSWGLFGGMQVILSAFLVPPQVKFQCHVSELNETDWTLEQQRNFSIPIIDGNYSQCLKYRRNYSDYISLSYEEALLLVESEESHTGPITEPCSHWHYDQSVFLSTLISDYDLVCDRYYLRSFDQSVFMLGVMVASPIGGIWADWNGRLPVIWFSLVGFLSVGLLIYYVYNFFIFLTARFLLGVFGYCVYQTSYILVVEWSLPRRRNSFGLSFALPFAIGYMILPGIAYFIRDYRELLLCLGCSSLCLITSLLIITESPRWSIQHGRTNQAVKAIDRACRFNSQSPLNKEWLIQTFNGIRKMSDKSEMYHEKRKKSIKDCCFSSKKTNNKEVNNSYAFLASSKLQKYTVILSSNWIICTMVYYGVALNTGSFNFDPFLYIFLSGLVELPAYTLIIPIVAKFGRKLSLITTYIISGAFLTSVVCVPLGITYWASLSLNMAGKLSITCAFQILLLYTSEIFPTCVRTQGVGITMMIGRLGAISSPFVIDILGAKFWALPNIIFGCLSFLGGLLTLTLPETYQKNLPDTAEDIENWSNNSSLSLRKDNQDYEASRSLKDEHESLNMDLSDGLSDEESKQTTNI